ncbi:MAG: penicillin acylase family protein [Dehalococcoidales bacterium]|nr:MAG: penicillin acylase family protein [Dehalococcoidales bacterium]
MKRGVRITLTVVAGVVAVALIGGYIWFYNATRSPLPEHNGEISLAGLKDSVEILRDEWGIPHIYASNMHDLFFAQGYTQAQDRWWQMEFWRHQGSGRIEELVGKNSDILAADIFIRSFGWRRVAEEEAETCDEETLGYLQSFADGVNAYIMNRKPGKLAMEYSFLGLTGIDISIEEWTPVDSLVWAKVMAWDLGFKGCRDELRATLYQEIGQEMTDQLLTPPWPYSQKPTIVQSEDLPAVEGQLAKQPDSGGIFNETEVQTVRSTEPIPYFSGGQGLGSNNWVVSGNLTESGRPLLANDPHLGIQMPSIWYQIGLHCHSASGEQLLDVTGFALSAVPGVVIGHNERIAWGVTNLAADVYDLYQIKVNPDNPLQYDWNGEWRDMTVHQETIRFGDGEPSVTIQVRQTHLGPIINDNHLDEESDEILGFNNEDPLALCWTALNPSTICQSLFHLNRANNWEEFRQALAYWDVPSQNFVYADVEGNIGYQMPGRIPIRSQGHSGLLPVPGWTDEFEWEGFIPYDSLPRIFNPERGYIVTANQAVVPLEYFQQLAEDLGEGPNYVFGQEWNYGYRGQRIVDLLEEGAPHNVASFQAIQGDNKLISAMEIMPFLENLAFGDTELTDARDWLLEWDHQCDMESPEAVLYSYFWSALMHNLYADQLARDITGEDVWIDGDSTEMWATFMLMAEPDNIWWDDITTEEITETRDDILVRSFREGYNKTKDELGADRDRWQWGKLHTSTFVSNPLGASGIGLIERLVNRGPFATAGTTDAVNATRWVAADNNLTVATLPSMRMIVDLGDLGSSLTVHTTGQSGHPYSQHYDDMIDPWRNSDYYPMLWARNQVESAAVNHITLIPAE